MRGILSASGDGRPHVNPGCPAAHPRAIYVADRSTFSDPRLVRHLVETAGALSIPYQMRQPGSGGTDAGAIHRQLEGIPSVSVSVPARYLHTAASICRLEDIKNTRELLFAALARLTPDILKAER